MYTAKRFLQLALLALCLGTTALAQGQGKGKAKGKADPNSLYSRLGGRPAITAVVDKMVEFIAADERVNAFFQTTAADPKRMAKFKKNLTYQICEATGGPEKYKGKDMVAAHTGMGLTAEHFGAVVDDLVKALDFHKVPEKEKNELLAALGPMQKDIVGK